MSQIQTLLIANRGEIARRIIRTCRAMAISPVVVYSDADADAPFVREADAGVRLPGNAAADTYLRGELVVAAALRLGAQAVHPGYGFLSENAAFAQSAVDAGLVWVGPPPSAINAMGSKIEAKRLARAHGVPVAPDNTVETLDEIGLPALVKASAGGGGRGMRIVRAAHDMADAIASAEREAAASFGDGTVFVERYVEGARHVEVQVFADSHGNVVALGERDCTIQRRHQKVVEEAPSPAVDPALRERMFAAAVAAARAVGYVGAGTVEFMLATDGTFSFLEMNTRLQVEHPVTEMVTGLDLVELQLRVAQGEPLPERVLHGVESRGHAIEVRLCTEDPYRNYLPSSGTFHHVEFQPAPWLRVDSAIESGSEVSSHYDSMVAKVIAHGDTRAEAARRLRVALERATICGPTTNRALLIHLMTNLATIDDPSGHAVHTGWLDQHDLGDPPSPSALQVAAAALAVVSSHHRGSPFPIGWRNNPSQPHTQAIGDHVVAYVFDRADRLELLHVDGEPVELDAFTRDQLARIDTCVVDDKVFVAGGLFAIPIPPRFVDPDDAGRAGSTVAPMPGRVIRLLVAAGDEVAAGQPLLIIEAMKMEHQVVSPTTGTVAEVFVRAGDQLDHGQPLVKVDPA
ncbi:MAG: ATP-grasp domain-containing protein [Actinobacteria bacterium]|nr:ATP-grasp domain-containing protein [Actinomycetota bacterium]